MRAQLAARTALREASTAQRQSIGLSHVCLGAAVVGSPFRSPRNLATGRAAGLDHHNYWARLAELTVPLGVPLRLESSIRPRFGLKSLEPRPNGSRLSGRLNSRRKASNIVGSCLRRVHVACQHYP